MNKEQYIEELKARLQGLEEDEIADAICYCEEYFEEAQSDEKVMEALGTPAQFASRIKTESAFKTTKDPNNYRKPHSMIKSFFMILGGLFALPIALPLLFVAVLLFIVFGLVIFILAIAGGIAVFAMLYGAIATFLMSFFYADGMGDICMHLGASLVFLGAAILLLLGVRYLIRYVLPVFVNTIANFYQRHKEKGETTYEKI